MLQTKMYPLIVTGQLGGFDHSKTVIFCAYYSWRKMARKQNFEQPIPCEDSGEIA